MVSITLICLIVIYLVDSTIYLVFEQLEPDEWLYLACIQDEFRCFEDVLLLQGKTLFLVEEMNELKSQVLALEPLM